MEVLYGWSDISDMAALLISHNTGGDNTTFRSPPSPAFATKTNFEFSIVLSFCKQKLTPGAYTGPTKCFELKI